MTSSEPTAEPHARGESHTSPSEKLDAKTWRTIAVVILAPFMTAMDSTVINVSLSTITTELHTTVSTAQWIISGYLLALALVLPVNGWLVDRIGAKKLYLICFSAFTAASVLCGAAHTIDSLIISRIVQGIAGGLLAPLTQLMIARVAGKNMVRVFGYAAAPILIAPLLGPILAGAILKYADWSWLFYINLPVGILAIILAIFFVPHDETLIRKRPFDTVGFLLISPGLVAFVYGFEAAAHGHDLWLLVLGIILLGTFVVYSRRQKTKALIDLELFKIKTYTVAAITQFLSNGIIYAGSFLIPLYLTEACKMSPSETGWLISLSGIGMFFIFPFLGSLTERFGCRAVATYGVVVNFFATLPFVWMAWNGFSMPLVIASLLIRGFGQGSTGIPSVAAAYASVPKDQLSYATTALNIVQRLGGPIMTTAVAIVVSYAANAPASEAAPRAFVTPFVALIIFQLFVFLSAIHLPVRVHE